MKNKLPSVEAVANSELIARTNLNVEQVIAKIHFDFALSIDSVIREALDEVNHVRRSKQNALGEPLKEHFSFVRYRIVQPPKISDMVMELHLMPIDFAYVALLKDPNTQDSAKTYIIEKVNDVAKQLAAHFRSNHLTLNASDLTPLGLEMTIITKDGSTLLRRRGKSVLTEADEWDVAFSGYCGTADVSENMLNIGYTARHELKREIGDLSADPSKIMITGLHRNTINGAIDILGYWEIDATTEQLAELLSQRYPGAMKIFETTQRAEEHFVWDTSNLIIDFDSIAIYKTLKQVGLEVQSLTPEALVCLLLALESTR